MRAPPSADLDVYPLTGLPAVSVPWRIGGGARPTRKGVYT